MVWFEVENAVEIEGGIKEDEYKCVTSKDLLQSISGAALFVYAEIKEYKKRYSIVEIQ